jgi:hypothetical protein
MPQPDDSILPLAAPLDGDALQFWPRANREVLWGWKRDVGAQSRMVYYSARLVSTDHGIGGADSFFVYRHRTHRSAATGIYNTLRLLERDPPAFLEPITVEQRDDRRSGLGVVTVRAGVPDAADRDRVRRLALRRPRASLGDTRLGSPSPPEAISHLLPADLYLGSGVSYEAGLPTLCDVHDAFCLDDHSGGTFTVGAGDDLPRRLVQEPRRTVEGFCRLHVLALHAQPTRAQQIVAELQRRGLVPPVLTDNVDNLLMKTGVPFTRTRGSGVFNERFPVEFQTRTLIVVGVAADRREIVRQARARRMRVVVVNPCTQVSPRVQHLNYVRPRDLFFRETADSFFSRLHASLNDAPVSSNGSRTPPPRKRPRIPRRGLNGAETYPVANAGGGETGSPAK